MGVAQTAAEGGYIVVRGAVNDCKEWTNRILDAVKIENQAPVTILNLPGFSVVGLNHEQVESKLSEAIKTLTGRRPETLSVEILASDVEYQTIAKEYYTSLALLIDGECPFSKARNQKIDRDQMKDRLQKIENPQEKIRLMEISRRIV